MMMSPPAINIPDLVVPFLRDGAGGVVLHGRKLIVYDGGDVIDHRGADLFPGGGVGEGVACPVEVEDLGRLFLDPVPGVLVLLPDYDDDEGQQNGVHGDDATVNDAADIQIERKTF